MIVATAGHIDHGKTTLVRVLTGIDTDQLPEEKARGISIDVGFAHMTLPDGTIVGFVDVPGHERFIRNMLSGVYAVGHALLVVAADDGLMPQTREHLHILTLLGVAAGAVAITKIDRVDAARIARVRADVGELLQEVGAGDFQAFPVSATTMQGIDALRAHLAQAARARGRAEDIAGAHARFAIDRVFVAKGSGAVARGTVLAGVIATGDTLVVSPSGAKARVRRLQRHGRTVDSARGGERCAINIAGVEHTAVARGDWLVAEAAHRPTDCLDIRVRLLPGGDPVRHWAPVHVHIGAADAPARLALQRGAQLAAGEEGFAQLRLSRAIHAARGDRLILRDPSASRTLGGGAVVNPFPPRRRDQRRTILDALHGRSPEAGLRALLDASSTGVDLEWFARAHAIAPPLVAAWLPKDALVSKSAPTTAMSKAHVEALGAKLVTRLERFHRNAAGAVGMEIADLHVEIGRGLRLDLFAEIVRRCAAQLGLEPVGSQLRRAGHDSTRNPLDQRKWAMILPILDQAGFHIPSARELSDELRLPLADVRDLLHRKAAAGELVKLTAERFALPDVFEALEAKARATARKSPDGQFKAAQFRDSIGTGRTLAIEILECMDKVGVTLRRGDLRSIADDKRGADGGRPTGRDATARTGAERAAAP